MFEFPRAFFSFPGTLLPGFRGGLGKVFQVEVGSVLRKPDILKKFCALVFLAVASVQAAPPEPSPDDPACTDEDRRFMQRAIALAGEALKQGNSPFGAVLVVDGKIVAEFQNEVAGTHDPTRHAELGLISKFSPTLDRATLARSTLYASTEPCTMCCGAVLVSGIPNVVYGVTEAKFLTYFPNPPSSRPLTAREIFSRASPAVDVRGPLLEKEGLPLHESYWPQALKKWSGSGK